MHFPFDMSSGLGEDFSGQVSLFPLPNVVLFPNVLLPLHIFEPRYIEMTRDALAGDQLISLAMLKPGWEIAESGLPEIYPVICVGKIAHHVELADGRYNLIVQGLQRASVVEELPLSHLYRQAIVELLAEEPIDNASVEDQRRAQLLDGFRQLFPKLVAEPELQQVFESSVPLGTLCDVFAYAMSPSAEEAQQLLAEFSVERRSRLLLNLMETALIEKAAAPTREFPPPFSLN